MPTDDDLVLGKSDNFATQTTFIIGSKPDPGGEYLQFRGYPSHTILQVTPDPVVGQRPISLTDGVTIQAILKVTTTHAVANNSVSTSAGTGSAAFTITNLTSKTTNTRPSQTAEQLFRDAALLLNH